MAGEGVFTMEIGSGTCQHTHPPEVLSLPCPAPVAAEVVPVIHEKAPVIHEKKTRGKISSTESVYALCYKQLANETQECFLVIPLNIHGERCSSEKYPGTQPILVAKGQRDRVHVDNGDILRPVIDTNAAGFIVVHQHPSGHSEPSEADRALTLSIKEACKPYTFRMLDHCVVGKGEIYSIEEDRLYKIR